MSPIKTRIAKAWRFLRDLFLDAHAAVSFTAPIISLAFTLAKFFGVPIPGIAALSYAWAFFPLAIWFLVGYARRREMTDRTDKIRRLKIFYSSVDHFMNARTDDFEIYVANADSWANECANWIQLNMGPLAASRFTDRSSMMATRFRGAQNERHNQVLMNLTRLKTNLKEMIENPVWDND